MDGWVALFGLTIRLEDVTGDKVTQHRARMKPTSSSDASMPKLS
jgi:hypothetical protein